MESTYAIHKDEHSPRSLSPVSVTLRDAVSPGERTTSRGFSDHVMMATGLRAESIATGGETSKTDDDRGTTVMSVTDHPNVEHTSRAEHRGK